MSLGTQTSATRPGPWQVRGVALWSLRPGGGSGPTFQQSPARPPGSTACPGPSHHPLVHTPALAVTAPASALFLLETGWGGCPRGMRSRGRVGGLRLPVHVCAGVPACFGGGRSCCRRGSAGADAEGYGSPSGFGNLQGSCPGRPRPRTKSQAASHVLRGGVELGA